MHFNQISGCRGFSNEGSTRTRSRTSGERLPACLVHELDQRGFRTAVQVPLPVIYDGVRLDFGFRLDILVEDCKVVEIKAVDAISPVHQAQLLTYLKLSHKHLGLLINFNVVHLRDGIRRMVSGDPPSTISSESMATSGVRPASSVSSVSSVVSSEVSTAKQAS
jgi:GxxExxY protein